MGLYKINCIDFSPISPVRAGILLLIRVATENFTTFKSDLPDPWFRINCHPNIQGLSRLLTH